MPKRVRRPRRTREVPPQPATLVLPRVQAPPRLLSYQVANVQGIGMREEQQDSFGTVNGMDVTLMREQGMLAMVADGMGGMTGGSEASACTVQTIMDAFRERDSNQDIPSWLVDVAAAANGRVYEMLGTSGGSTLVLCLLWHERLWYVSVGDSYLFLLREGTLVRVNQEHNGRSDRGIELLEQGVYSPELTDSADEPTAVTSYIGTDEPMKFDRFLLPLSLQDGDTLLLCSDGIGGALSEEGIRHALSQTSASAACQEISQDIRSLADPYQDNYTGIVIKCMR